MRRTDKKYNIVSESKYEDNESNDNELNTIYERDEIIHQEEEENGTSYMEKQKSKIVQEETEVFKEDVTEEHTDEGYDENASEIPNIKCIGAGIERLEMQFDGKTYTHKIHQRFLTTKYKHDLKKETGPLYLHINRCHVHT